MTRARNSTVRSRENQDPDGYGSYVVRAGSSHGESGFVGGGRELKIGGGGSPVKPEKERPPRLEGNGGRMCLRCQRLVGLELVAGASLLASASRRSRVSSSSLRRST